MPISLVQHPQSIEINGVKYSHRSASDFAASCRLAASVIRAQAELEQHKNEWYEWCAKNTWSPDLEPSHLVGVPPYIVQLYWSYQSDVSEEPINQREWQNLRNDSIFAQVYTSDLTAEQLDDMASEILGYVSNTTHRIYEHIYFSGTEEERRTAEQLRVLWRVLLNCGVSLRWPKPPFENDFFEVLGDEIEFQVRWSIQLLEAEKQLSEQSRQNVVSLSTPYSEQDVTKQIQLLRAEKSSDVLPVIGGSLTLIEKRRLQRLKNWMVVWEGANQNARILLEGLDYVRQRTSESSNFKNMNNDPASLLYEAWKNNKYGLKPMQKIERYLASVVTQHAEEVAYSEYKEQSRNNVLLEIGQKTPQAGHRFFILMYVFIAFVSFVLLRFDLFASEDHLTLVVVTIWGTGWLVSRHVKLVYGDGLLNIMRRWVQNKRN